TTAKIAMAYTFHTQTILSQANRLAALPYTTDPTTAAPGAVTAATATVAFAKYGGTLLPTAAIDEILETDITTFDALNPATGAFFPNPAQAVPTPIHVLIATPLPGTVTKMCGSAKCAPLMVFRHGLNRGRA